MTEHNESTVALIHSDDPGTPEKTPLGGYDTERLNFLTEGFVRLFMLIASADGSDYATSALMGCVTTMGPRVLELTNLQAVLRDTADALPDVYKKNEERNQAARSVNAELQAIRERRKDLN